MTITKQNIAAVEEVTGYPSAKAEKYLKEVWKDLEEDGEVTFEDVMEVIGMEHKVKVNGVKNVVQSDKKSDKKDKKPRTVKVSDEKVQLFSEILANLQEIYGNSVEIAKENKLILVKLSSGKEFKVDLVETRPKKS